MQRLSLLNLPRRKTLNKSNMIKDSAPSTARSIYKSSVNFKARHLSEMDFDKEIVEKLEFWNYKSGNDCLTRINTARGELIKNLNRENVVQQLKIQRNSEGKTNKAKEDNKFYKEYEEECMGLYKNAKIKLENILAERDGVRKNIIDLKNEQYKYTNSLAEIEKKLVNEIKRAKSPIMKQETIAIYLNSKRTLQVSMQTEKFEVVQQLEMIEIELKHQEKELHRVEDAVVDLRKNLKIIKSNITQHYLKILSEGVDTNGEGLQYSVKHLLDLGIEVKLAMFPSCLDRKTIETIVKIAEKNIELESLVGSLALAKSNKISQSLPKEDLKKRLAKLAKTIRTRKPDYSKNKALWQKSELKDKEEIVEYIQSETSKIEENIRKVRDEILEIQISEVKRITKECVKSGKNIKNLASCVVGSDYIERFMIHMYKEIKDRKSIKDQLKTFSFTSRLLPQPKNILEYY